MLDCRLLILAALPLSLSFAATAPPPSPPAPSPNATVRPDAAVPDATLAAALGAAMVQTPGLVRDDRRWRSSLAASYSARSWQPLWSTPNGATRNAFTMIALLEHAADYGLDPRDYDPAGLTARAQAMGLVGAAGGAARAQFDAALSLASARFISDLHSGRVDPRSVGHDLDVPHAALDVGAAVAGAAGSGDLPGVIGDFEPAFRHYDLLKTALARYRQLASDPTLTQLPPLPSRSVKPGQTYAGAAALRRLLQALGDMPAEAPPQPASAAAVNPAPADADAANLLDDGLVAGLRSFQQRHGLGDDGALGAATWAALTTPLSTRVRQIEMSLERSRWLPPRLSSPPILVNIPQFRLFAFYTTADSEALLLQMNVIVGKTFPTHNTPVFAADMRYVVIRPYWDVPSTILHNEFLAKIRANPGWLARNRFQIVRGEGDDGAVMEPSAANIEALARGQYRLRQMPGDSNSLGVAKLMFPNRHNVYLHGTPAQGLFAQTRRAFSHGCVRVEDPLGLAAFVLRDQPQYPRAKLEELAKLDRPTRINLTQPVRVFIMYATAIATESGRVLFFEDIYGHDRKLAAKLFR